MKKEDIKDFVILDTSLLIDAMKKIDNNGKGILYVLNEKEQLIGVISDGDIRRWLIRTGELNNIRVELVMNNNPKVVTNKDLSSAIEKMEQYSLTSIPLISLKNKILDIYFIGAFKITESVRNESLKGVPVIIMAGGKGTRLYPYTKILPKPLIPIGDIPIVERIINKFLEYGTEEFYFTVNYKKEMIKSYFQEIKRNYRIKYIEEDKPLGTCGSITLIDEEFDKPIIVSNCDILIYADYEDIYKHHLKSGNEITVITSAKNIQIPYGVINSTENGKIESVDEKPKFSYFINTGMYILNPNLIDEIPKDEVFHMTDLVTKLLKEKRDVGIYPISEDAFLDMGEFEEMDRMEKKLAQIK